MKHSLLTRKFAALGGALVLALSILMCPVASLPVQAATSEDNAIMPLSTIKEWRYKIENKKLYRRLYNITLNIWEGEWIYVCEWPYDIPSFD